ncbi:3-methyladenine DNA glycosylase [Jatrophihabitans sp. DSM 45814]
MSEVLAEAAWRASEQAHHARIDAATASHRERAQRAKKHPVEDFMFTYYSYRPAQLRSWHPGIGIRLEGASERSAWKSYHYDGTAAYVDPDAFLSRKSQLLAFASELLHQTEQRPAQFGCFGLHEWAMVYRLQSDDRRHPEWPLRLGATGTDAVVEAHHLKCTHIDAYRFFTPPARPLNLLTPQRETQTAMEQPGCLHANMDLYKWAHKLAPAVSSDLIADCFELARDIRVLDMRASPYDLAELGIAPLTIETTDGKAAYARAQQAFALRAATLRSELLDACQRIADHSSESLGAG